MPRPLRVHVEGALSYVTAQAATGVLLFRDAKDYATYREFLTIAQEKFAFKLFAFALLPDQVHLCLELASGTTVSTVMHALHTRYTKYVTNAYGHSGHLFQERFKLTLIEKAPSLLQATAFAHRLPQRSGLAGSLRDYAWSNYLAYLAAGNGSSSRGEVQEVLGTLSRERPGLTYEQYVQSIPEHELDQIERSLQQRVVGSEAFRAMVEERSHKSQKSHPWLGVQGSGFGASPQPPAPSPEPTHPSSFFLVGSQAVAFLALCAAGFYSQNILSLQRTVQALARERVLTFTSAGGAPAETPLAVAQLASFARPVQLSGTTWQVQVKPMDAAGGEVFVGSDELRFEQGKVASRTLSVKGFLPAHYTLTRQERGTAVWETMQTDQVGTIVSWRGEWDGRTMHGILTRQVPGQSVAHFNFVGVLQQQGPMGSSTSET